mmetsp:Transcript_91765/g.233389  ORF Transcript_91765/g.233389 Transcript_91765/m.233389 type:complete len:95 (-) Transcript_91765:121-405(-)
MSEQLVLERHQHDHEQKLQAKRARVMARESAATEAAMPPLVVELTTVLPVTGTLSEVSFKVRPTETQPAASPQYIRHIAKVGSNLPPVESMRAW